MDYPELAKRAILREKKKGLDTPSKVDLNTQSEVGTFHNTASIVSIDVAKVNLLQLFN